MDLDLVQNKKFYCHHSTAYFVPIGSLAPIFDGFG